MSYNATNIQVLEGLDAVRKRPGMYIGTTGSKGLHHLLWEILDNSIDEVANGYGDEVEIDLFEDGSASVKDNGRGIPFDIHPEYKISGVELIFTKLHAGGKFENENYVFSGGLHGVGAAVTNALSKYLVVEMFKNGERQVQRFHSPKDKDGKVKSGIKDGGIKKDLCSKNLKGTKVTFLPDDEIFPKETFSFEIISKRIRELAFLNAGLKISVTDHRVKDENNLPRKREFYYQSGLSDLVKYINDVKVTLYNTPIYIEHKEKTFEFAACIQHTDGYTENTFSYVNNIPTADGGTHEVGFKSALTKVLNDYARSKGILKDKQPNFLGEDFREGITAVLSIKMQNPQFEGQTKNKLGNPDVRVTVEGLTTKLLEKYLKKADKSVIDGIYKKAKEAATVREKARQAKQLARQKNKIASNKLVGKLSDCSGKNKKINEIFIVEGDSAGGSAKQGRNRSFQAILPLKGKPLNVEKKRMSEILANDEMASIINALGTGIEQDFDIGQLNYDKVIILADADQDGAHIRAILLTFFYRYMKPLITEGHIYIGMPPLYKVEYKKEVKYAYDDEQLEEILSTAGRSYTLQRYKGLGEMNPEQLWETTMDPENRTLTRVLLEDAAEAESMISILMGDNVDVRREYISENANFNQEDLFLNKI